METWELEPGGLWKPVHQVHTLDGVSGCAFHEIVQRTDDNQPVSPRLLGESDLAKVRSLENFRLREAVQSLALFDDPEKRLLLEFAPENLPDVLFFDVWIR